MIHITRGRVGPAAQRSGTFTGEVWGDPVLPETDDVLINNVFFAAGARTYWHTHGAGQVLVVTAGAGQVYDRDGNGGPLATGDVVFIPPGIEHWHGATDTSFLLHLAISLRGHEWLDEVTENEFRRGG